MTVPIDEITIGGATITLTDVEYQVTISHGRNDIKSQPEASTAQIILRGAQGLDVGLTQAVYIAAYGQARFTGEVTDLAITHLSAIPPVAVTTITCIGNLSNLGDRVTGAAGYPDQTVQERAEEILTDSGETYLNGGTPDLDLYAISSGQAQAVSCLEGLAQLAEWSGATYFDLPDGRIVFESYGQRGVTAFPGIWASQALAWHEYAQAWNTFPTSFAALSIDADAVVFTPSWAQNQTSIINDITVTHGSTAHSDQDEDAASIALYGRRAYVLTTGLDKHADAITRASAILLAQAYPLWNLGNISLRMEAFDSTARSEVLDLVNGSSVLINGLPQPAPLEQFLGIVEGWSETYVPGRHTLTLSISDPRYSYQTVTWAGVDPALTWGGVDPTIAWYNVVRSDDLVAA